MKRNERRVLVIVLTLVGVLFRLAFVDQSAIGEPLRADALQYDRYGVNLVEQGIYSLAPSATAVQPDSLRSPGFPLLRAVVYAACGDHQTHLDVLLYLQAILGALCIPTCYLLGRRLGLPAWASLTSASLTALSPHLVVMSGYHLTETLFSLAMVTALLGWAYCLRRPTVTRLLLTGLLFGWTTLVNETALLLLPVLVVLAWRAKSLRTWQLATPALGLAVVVLPWMIRNWTTEQPEGLRSSTRAIATLSHGAYPDFTHEDPAYRFFPYREDPEQPKFGSSLSEFFSILGKRIGERPARYLLWYSIEKPCWAWTWNILQGQGGPYVYPVHSSLLEEQPVARTVTWGMRTLHLPIALLGLVGMAVFVIWPRDRRRHPATYLWWSLIYFTMIWVVFVPWPRYSIPLRPELYLSACAALTLFLRKRSQRAG